MARAHRADASDMLLSALVGACIYAFASFAIFHLLNGSGLLGDEVWWGRIQAIITLVFAALFAVAAVLRHRRSES